MSDTTFTEAKRCPKCEVPGEDRRQSKAPQGATRGAMLHYIFCMNERCEWFDTCWIVQVNPDGSVPPKANHTGQPKVYEGFEGHDKQARDIRAALEADKRHQQSSGGHFEIGRRI